MVSHCKIVAWSYRETMPREVGFRKQVQFGFSLFRLLYLQLQGAEKIQLIIPTLCICSFTSRSLIDFEFFVK